MKALASFLRLFRRPISPSPMPFCLTAAERHDYELLQLARDAAWERARLKAQFENLQFHQGELA